MVYAFAVHPRLQPHQAKLFCSENAKSIVDFDPAELEKIINGDMFFGGTPYDIEDMEFFDLGEHKPITFEKQVSYTINQK